jgi:signal transduction histidine kinase
MTRNSLRLRLLAGGLAAIAVVLTIAGVGLTLIFERHVARSLAEDLDVHLKQLVAGIDVDKTGGIVITRQPADPRFADPLSGLYWQVSDDHAQFMRSRSLWDASLDLGIDQPAPGEVHHHEISGPGGSRLMVAERRVRLNTGDAPTIVRLAVASDLARVAAAKSAFAHDVILALVLLGVVLAVATVTQVVAGLRPLDALRRAVADIRSGQSHRLSVAAPAEVTPLIEEVNALLDAREQEIERSRNRAADLAHGLKTPLAALGADGRRLREKGDEAIAADIEAAIDTMRRHVDRELTRARIRGGSSFRGAATAVAPLVRSLVATVSRTDEGARISYEVAIDDDALVPFDRTDLAEALGNLIENAARYARKQVRVTWCSATSSIVVEDDGPGISPDLRATVLARGVRFDERGTGAGLGLAIVQDVLGAYCWGLELRASTLGGLQATILPKPPTCESLRNAEQAGFAPCA